SQSKRCKGTESRPPSLWTRTTTFHCRQLATVGRSYRSVHPSSSEKPKTFPTQSPESRSLRATWPVQSAIHSLCPIPLAFSDNDSVETFEPHAKAQRTRRYEAKLALKICSLESESQPRRKRFGFNPVLGAFAPLREVSSA